MDPYNEIQIAVIQQMHADYIKNMIRGSEIDKSLVLYEARSKGFQSYLGGLDIDEVLDAWNCEVADIKAKRRTLSDVISDHH